MSSVTTSAMARVAYEARRVFCRALGEGGQPGWDQASSGERGDAIVGVEAVLSGRVRSGAQLHEAWIRRAAARRIEAPIAPSYDELRLDEKRKVLLFRAIVLAMIDGPCNGFCHDERCENLEDHACHLDTCMSRFGIPPGIWRALPAPVEHPAIDLFC